YYYTSQWNVPNSKRVISDGGVYRYIGYRLINGENPFNVDYWVPPLGKYWYGFSAKYFQNPYFTSFTFYLLSIFVFTLISHNLFSQKSIRWLATYLWVLNPLIVEQTTVTMLDLPLTLFFLLHLYFLFKLKDKFSLKFLLLSAISLGLMAGIKPAYFVPFIGIIDWTFIFIIQKKNRFKNLLLFFCFVIFGYVLSYTCYFLAHPNPIPWIRLHQKVIEFQRGNGGSHDILNIFKTIFLDKYKGFWVGGKEMLVTGWSFVLPLATLIVLKNLIFIKKLVLKNIKVTYLTVFSLIYIILCLTIDFWPRYLVLLVPSLILLTVDFLKDRKVLLILLLFSYLPWLKFTFFPDSQKTVDEYYQLINNQQYRDAYRLLDQNSRQKTPESEWLNLFREPNTIPPFSKPILEYNQWRISI
ncbi:MAG: phospholipid carrier-dependent glycosyltransferase, partial [Candidatus Shapirobacteria bacterium]|nr:phospholipid carrier-dependent glycosyltransferase [Candidatus Shapirobacteria bacterium]